MALLTAKQLKERETPEFVIEIGDGQQLLARRPDLQLLVVKGLLPVPLLTDVVKLIGAWMGKDIADISEDVIANSEGLTHFIDTMVCAALIQPRVVLTADGLTDDTLLVTDLTLQTKKKIMQAITDQFPTPEVVADATTFPEVGSSEGTGRDVPTLSAAAV